ncbi:MAG: hypothetical protein FJY88_11755, partial [Candidatus Eisenbacteria bacterium]|nr:hypothetical protein [Candidatus Eisenbacteria bacterium]
MLRQGKANRGPPSVRRIDDGRSDRPRIRRRASPLDRERGPAPVGGGDRPEGGPVSLFDRLTGSLRKTRQLVADGLERAIGGSARIDERLFEELEETLLRGDVGPATTEELLSRLRRAVREKGVENPGEIPALLRGIAAEILEGAAAGPAPPAMERPARRTAEGGSGVDPGGVDGAPPPAPSAGVAPRPARPHVILVCGVNGVGKTTTIAKLARRYAVA